MSEELLTGTEINKERKKKKERKNHVQLFRIKEDFWTFAVDITIIYNIF